MDKLSASQFKASIISLFIISVAFISIQTIPAATPADDAWYPNAMIPPHVVNMAVVYGTDSYFDITLSGIYDPMYDVQNGTYKGWCFEKAVSMDQTGVHPVLLNHSYDPNKPDVFHNANWDMINYIINHKNGWDKDTIQETIWYFIEGTATTSPTALALIEEVEQKGSGFCPTEGDLLAVLIYLDPGIEDVYPDPVQNTFIEVPLTYDGCPPCFWWANIDDIYGWTGIDPDECLCDYFDLPPPFDMLTFRQVLSGSYMISCGCVYPTFYCYYGSLLLEEAAAALLNIYHGDITYPLDEGQLVNSVNDAMLSGFSMLRLWLHLNMYNQLGDPICACCVC